MKTADITRLARASGMRISTTGSPGIAIELFSGHVRELVQFVSLVKAEFQKQGEPVAYANWDELDNMLDDRTATIAGVRDGWRNTPLFLRPAPCVPGGVMSILRELHDESILSEGQIAKALDVDRVTCRAMLDEAQVPTKGEV